MEITEVKVFPVQEEKLKAFVSIVFDRCFMVNDIKIINGRDGLFISMPSRKKKNGDYKDVAHPLNNETRGRIQERILVEYRQVVGEEDAAQPERGGDAVAAAGAGPSGDAEPAIENVAAPAAAAATPEVEEEAMPVAEASPAAGDGLEIDTNEEKTLDEVTEKFSSESFWTA